MKSSNGTKLHYTLFGESHSSSIGITIQGIPAGTTIDFEQIHQKLALRSGKQAFNTPRQEEITYEILSGYFNDHTTGTPLTVIFPNQNTQSKDYSNLIHHPRPGHADHTAAIKYQGYQDYRGGGHFSGRLTTPLVFLGAIALQLLQKHYPHLHISSHIAQFGTIKDTTYYDLRRHAVEQILPPKTSEPAALFMDSMLADHKMALFTKELQALRTHFNELDPKFPLINQQLTEPMLQLAHQTREQNDTIGGRIETVVFAPPLAVGEPFFHSVESTLASLLFSVGSVKAVEFGYGTQFQSALGSEVKDEIIELAHDHMITLFNYNGGINGGISNGEDLVMHTTLKPIASLLQPQHTFHKTAQKVDVLSIQGRHDATIINRVIPVIDAMVAIGLYDLYLQK